jgi:hypothetical protein
VVVYLSLIPKTNMDAEELLKTGHDAFERMTRRPGDSLAFAARRLIKNSDECKGYLAALFQTVIEFTARPIPEQADDASMIISIPKRDEHGNVIAGFVRQGPIFYQDVQDEYGMDFDAYIEHRKSLASSVHADGTLTHIEGLQSVSNEVIHHYFSEFPPIVSDEGDFLEKGVDEKYTHFNGNVTSPRFNTTARFKKKKNDDRNTTDISLAPSKRIDGASVPPVVVRLEGEAHSHEQTSPLSPSSSSSSRSKASSGYSHASSSKGKKPKASPSAVGSSRKKERPSVSETMEF